MEPKRSGKKTTKEEVEPGWLTRIKEREHFAKMNSVFSKSIKLIKARDPITYNFGVMHDFMNYSGLSIQHCV